MKHRTGCTSTFSFITAQNTGGGLIKHIYDRINTHKSTNRQTKAHVLKYTKQKYLKTCTLTQTHTVDFEAANLLL